MTALIPVQKSQIMQWKKCPKAFEDIWILRHPMETSIPMELGRGFHSEASHFFKIVDCDSLSKCKTKESAYSLFEQYLPKHPIVKEWMENFFRFEALRWEGMQKIKLWKPLVTELELTAPSIGFMPMHIDRIDRMRSGYIIVIDYKTGGYMKLADIRFELTFYAIGMNASKYFNKLVTYGAIYNPAKKWQWVEEIKTRTIMRVMKTVAAFRQSIRKSEFPRKISLLCRYCSSLERCIEADVFKPEQLEMINGGDN